MSSTMSEYKIKMDRIYTYLGNECTNCGSKENLEIDHKDYTTKKFTITPNWGLSWDKLKPELDKCQLLCSFHHIEKSKSDGTYISWNNKPRQNHGTVHSYNKYKCRCDLCKSAKSQAMKKEYLKKKNRV